MPDEKKWTPEYDEATLRALIADVIRAGGADEVSIPASKIRERIKARIKGDIDLDALIRDVQIELRKDK